MAPPKKTNAKARWYEWHPDKDEIIRLIEKNTPSTDISGLLRSKYPTNIENWIDFSLLALYRRKNYPELILRRGREQKKVKNRQVSTTNAVVPEVRGVLTNPDDDISTKIMKLTGQTPRAQEPRKVLTDEQLVTWVSGLDGFKLFAEELTIERGIPVRLQDYQMDMAKLFIENDRVCICAGGQIGKDFMMQEMMLWIAITKSGSSQVLICATQAQSVALLNRILVCLKSSEDLQEAFAGSSMKPDPAIYFKNGSRVLFLTAKSLVAGHTALNYVWVNEARDINEDEVTRVSPLLGVGGGKLFVLSRPRFRRGYFWDCFSNPVFKSLVIPTDKNKFFDRKVLETERVTLSRDLFRIEYLAEFADAGSAYISETAIKNCSRAEFEYKSMVPDPEYEYLLGMDWARLRDTCVITVLGRNKKTGNLKIFHLHSFDPEGSGEGGMSSFSTQFAYISMLDDKFGFSKVIPESSGMGIPLCDALIQDWRKLGKPAHLIKPYENRSLQSKLAMYEELKRVIENERIEIPRGASRLINELMMIQFGTTVQGALKLETPITDDFADSLALACLGFAKIFKPGVAVVNIRMKENPL